MCFKVCGKMSICLYLHLVVFIQLYGSTKANQLSLVIRPQMYFLKFSLNFDANDDRMSKGSSLASLSMFDIKTYASHKHLRKILDSNQSLSSHTYTRTYTRTYTHTASNIYPHTHLHLHKHVVTSNTVTYTNTYTFIHLHAHIASVSSNTRITVGHL